ADEPRLSPRKADLFRWRQGFADKLRELGIDAAASERRHRFNHRKSEHAVVRQIRADNPASEAFNARRAEAKATTRAMQACGKPQKAFVGPYRPPRVPLVNQRLQGELKAALATGTRPANPAHEHLEKNRAEALAGWEQVAGALDAAGDRELAHEVRELMRTGHVAMRSKSQMLYDTATARLGHVAGRDPDLAR